MTANSQVSLRILTPPPVVYLTCILIGAGLEYLWPLAIFPAVLQYAGYGIIVLSFALFAVVLRAFAKSSTSIDHAKSTTEIISSGPFKYSRNPVYLSMTMLHIGVSFARSSLWILGMAIPAVVVIHYCVIVKEEKYLQAKFGDEYRRYNASVRRWI